MSEPLKAPFPYFGGKAKVASLVWNQIGDVDNFIEPFAGSLAVLLRRPVVQGVETVNDLDGLLTNFWRAVRIDPERTAEYADWPVSELDLHARHRWLRGERERITEALRADPEWFDPKAAGWWCWGLCCWIGGGWCTDHGLRADGSLKPCMPILNPAKGVNVPAAGESIQIPRLSEPGVGIHADAGEYTEGRRPRIGGRSSDDAPGVLNPKGKRPRIGARKRGFTGLGVGYVDRETCERTSRPQLTDTFDIGRGVNANGSAGTCEDRRAWLVDWFGRLADRLRLVRVCCGHWDRVCDSPSVLTRLGTTGVFLDPPYSDQAGRNMKLYAKESGTVAHEVRAWCRKWGDNPHMRIVLAGYAGEGHEELEQHGWQVHAWETAGGYANQSGGKGSNAKKERLWFSPHCKNGRTLFDDIPEAAGVQDG